ncbi:cobalt/nickel transport protein [Micromonospora rhizosphaerae]|uniref:Cobalt/nickel transport protein n=1 Tax=Micromonospora rhizosphaerae TaxID=568872 RepID=A0A1C6RUA4_9ACTN|nr:PDGLE domain-containing protein [Micromonospora rhizosphaerae]SCL20703.1 cobalt/nickel transport protein [Micromonospora rhizosphaerae]
MRKRSWGFVLGGLLVALLLAGVVSNYASSHPDGLDSSLLKGCTVDANGEITGGSCPAQRTKDHELSDSPLADYGIKGVDSRFLSTGLSGVAGVLLTFVLGGGLFWLTRRRGLGPDGPRTGGDRTDNPRAAGDRVDGDRPERERAGDAGPDAATDEQADGRSTPARAG